MIAVALNLRFQVHGLERPELEQLFHAMGAEFHRLEEAGVGILDHAVSIDLGTSDVEVDITAVAETEDEAEIRAKGALLFALEQTGGSPLNGAVDFLIEKPIEQIGAILDYLGSHPHGPDVEVTSRDRIPELV